jgi:serpin B
MPVARRRAVPIAAAATLTTVLAAATPQGVAAQERNRADIQALTRAYNASGQMLFRDFAASPGNIVFSPYSIGSAMAMALAGTRGETEREMAAVSAARRSTTPTRRRSRS